MEIIINKNRLLNTRKYHLPQYRYTRREGVKGKLKPK